MGVKGLLKALKSIEEPKHISAYAGQTLAIDGYAWLHRGSVKCARELVMGLPTTQHIDYILRRLQILLDHDVRPYMVFDGDYLPSKAGVEEEREASRAKAKERAIKLWREGQTTQAMDQFTKCVDITPEIAANVIHVLKQHGIQFVVAPYEADAQLVYLEKQNIVQGIIAEDSDLLVFGAKHLLTKMDHTGSLIQVSRNRMVDCKEMCLAGVTDAQLRLIAILSGCDYSKGIANIGCIKANKIVRRFVTSTRVIRAMRLDAAINVPADFDTVCRRAELTFLYQRVYCAETKRLIHLNEPVGEIDEPGFEEFVGKLIDPSLSEQIALGKIDPMTKLPFDIRKFNYPSVKLVHRPVKRTIKSFFSPASTSPSLTPSSSAPLPQSHILSRAVSLGSSPSTRHLSTLNTESDVAKRARRLLNNNRRLMDNSSDDDRKGAPLVSQFFKRAKLETDSSNKENIAPKYDTISEEQLAQSSDNESIASSPQRNPSIPLHTHYRRSPVLAKSASTGQLAFKPGTLDRFVLKK